MFRGWLVLGLLLFPVLPLGAQTPPPGVDLAPPKSIWDIDLDGTATNPQSQLQCPPSLAGFQRNGVASYNPVGLDISCNYRGPAGLVTVYLARYPQQPAPQQYFDGAKQAILNGTPDAVARADVPAGPAGLSWVQGGFSEQDDKLNSDLWVASLSDWTAQIRATYQPAGLDAVAGFMRAYSDILARTAAPHLAACLASPPPQRSGVKFEGDHKILTALVLGGTMAAMQPIPAAQAKENWCVERALSMGGKPYIYWRNIAPDADRNSDRIAPLAPDGLNVAVVRDGGGKTLTDKPAGDDIYDVILTSDGPLSLEGIYVGEPSFETIANLLSNPHDVYAKGDPATRKVTLSSKVFQNP